MTNPYFIEGPALISFSGGRTSGFMLHQIVQAHGGTLPGDVHVNFANTGKEREETLRFVHECGSRWGVKINWIEYRPAAPHFELVGLNSASRDGEPFQALIDKKNRLPNWKERWCTQFLKVKPMTDFAASLGLAEGTYKEIVGLRNDEGHRILKALENANFVKKGKKLIPRVPPRLVVFPLARGKVRKADVMAFWASQPFDLDLEPWEGNCDLCFLKGRGIRKRIIRDNPSRAPWWSGNESKHKGKQERGWFDKRDSIAGLAAEVAAAPEFFDEFEAEEYEVECGLHCPTGDEA
ncbi:phosphoadenosine phosphosulfate reductase family protein [Sinorhizobium fredii]|uniref:phosphoadenosine phosphosulfate reductase domain-containing protein n=1 Tax=Rhizobium fredii TaxID=380 RepID=UPI0030A3AD6F